ncbi:MAG: hypothetical protein NT116_03230 [Candidatus Parcubacteria bacterium]|nr:hypothetical protein [Candidatus Parcubacteria bacterium]
MPGFGEAPKLEPAKIKKEKKEYPEFRVGQRVIVERSDGRVEKGWEVSELGERIRVINKAQRKGKLVSPEDLQKWTDIGFETGEPVMVKRSGSDKPEAGWQVHDFGQGIIEVNKIDKDGKPTVRKFVTPEELKEWNKR